MAIDKLLRYADLKALGIVNNRVTLSRLIKTQGFVGPEYPRVARRRGTDVAGVAACRACARCAGTQVHCGGTPGEGWHR
jgi:hypothetical protein